MGLPFENEEPFAVGAAASFGIAVLQQGVEPSLHLLPSKILGAAAEYDRQSFTSRRFNNNDAVWHGPRTRYEGIDRLGPQVQV